MPEITIANGATETIIPKQEAVRVQNDENIDGFVIDVQGDTTFPAVRFARGENKDLVRDGIPMANNDVWSDFDPQGHEVIMQATGAQATVNVNEQWFSLGETG